MGFIGQVAATEDAFLLVPGATVVLARLPKPCTYHLGGPLQVRGRVGQAKESSLELGRRKIDAGTQTMHGRPWVRIRLPAPGVIFCS